MADNEDSRKSAPAGQKPNDGPFLAKVVSHIDKTYMGDLQVQLLRESGSDTGSAGQIHVAHYCSPFYGVTSSDFVTGDPNDPNTDNYNNTQKAYGMWMIPPDVGTTVMVVYAQGLQRELYWFGCIQDKNMNFMLPGYASTYYNVDATKKTTAERVPVAEYNREANGSTLDATAITKPATPQEVLLNNQGLIYDDIRGITTSSARRETPSMVFGISTPGPFDKQDGAPSGGVGTDKGKIDNKKVSHLGGSSFVMDDGDDKFIRKTAPTDGPPDYEALEQLPKGATPTGDQTRPHNELIRLKTRTGHQILLHNSEDIIYITNSRGTAWVELSSDGKIDIYSEDSITMRTKADLNIRAERDINLEAGRNINMKATADYSKASPSDAVGQILDANGNDSGRIQIESAFNYNLLVGANANIQTMKYKDSSGNDATGNLDLTVVGNTKITISKDFDLNTTGHNWLTAGKTTEINSGGNHIETAPAIHMNGPTANTALTTTPAKVLPTFNVTDITVADPTAAVLSYQTTDNPIVSIMKRLTTHEPFPFHENLDPVNLKIDKLDREVTGDLTLSQFYLQYSATIDTFRRTPPQDT
jgi:hypothetical protein